MAGVRVEPQVWRGEKACDLEHERGGHGGCEVGPSNRFRSEGLGKDQD